MPTAFLLYATRPGTVPGQHVQRLRFAFRYRGTCSAKCSEACRRQTKVEPLSNPTSKVPRFKCHQKNDLTVFCFLTIHPPTLPRILLCALWASSRSPIAKVACQLKKRESFFPLGTECRRHWPLRCATELVLALADSQRQQREPPCSAHPSPATVANDIAALLSRRTSGPRHSAVRPELASSTPHPTAPKPRLQASRTPPLKLLLTKPNRPRCQQPRHIRLSPPNPLLPPPLHPRPP